MSSASPAVADRFGRAPESSPSAVDTELTGLIVGTLGDVRLGVTQIVGLAPRVPACITPCKFADARGPPPL